MELATEDAALSALVKRQAAGTVLPYLRAFDVWQRNINVAEPEDATFLACKAKVEEVAGDNGAALRVCVEEREELREPQTGQYRHMYEEWLQVMKGLLVVHQRLVLTCPRKHPRTGDAGMTQSVKFRLYALRNTPELVSLRSYWLAASCTAGVEPVVDEVRWDEIEGQASETTADHPPGSAGFAPHCAPAVDVVHQHARAPKWSLYVPAGCQRATVPLVLALHGARTLCDQHLLNWLPTARARSFAVLSLQSLRRSWGLRGGEEVVSDMIALLTTLDTVLAAYPALDAGRIFLTGMSDGGTFGYLCSDVLSRAGCTFAAGLAVTAAFPILSRMNEEQIVESLDGTPTHHVHGTKDWMFPIELARAADAVARKAVTNGGWQFTEVPSWTHASPSAVHEDIVWPWLSALPRNDSFSGDVQELLHKFQLFVLACEAKSSDSDDDT